MGRWSFLKKAVKGIGKVAQKAAPIIGLVPGVGTLAAAGIGGLGGLMSGGGLKGIAQGALGGAAGGLAGKIPGVGGFLSKGASKLLGGAQGLGGAIKGVGGLLGGTKGIGGLLGGAGQAGLDIPGLLMGGANTFMNAQDATRYRGIQDDQINYAKDQQARQRQIQDQILGNLNPALNVPDLNNGFADPSNPFYKGLTPPTPAAPGVGGGGMAPPVPSAPSGGGGSIGSMLIGVYGKGRIPPPQGGGGLLGNSTVKGFLDRHGMSSVNDPANDVMRRLSPVRSTGGGGGRVVPLDYGI